MKILILFLFPLFMLAQTSFTDQQIKAARGNDYEWLLTNTDCWMVESMIQHFTWAKTRQMPTFGDCGKNCKRYINNTKPFKDSKESVFYYDVITIPDAHKKDLDQIVKKVIFRGDLDRLIEFFTEFWSRTVNVDDIKKGEVASTRFLTDIAVFSFDKEGKPQIIVESTKDRE